MTIHPAIIWDIERREREVDNRLPLYVPMPEYEPEVPRKEIEHVTEF